MMFALSTAAVGLFLWAAASDVASRCIPNRLVGLLALVGLARIGWDLAVGGAVGPAAADLALAGGVLAAGAAAFGFGWFGGGDVKLMAAGALWLGAEAGWAFLIGTAAAGGALALGFLLWAATVGGGVPRPSLPYGVAVAAGGVLATFSAL